MTTNEVLYIAFLVVSVGDIYSTLRGLRAGLREGNPVMRWLFARMEPVVVMSVAYALVWALFWAFIDYPFMAPVLGFSVGLRVYVVLNNLKLARAAGG